MLQWAAMRASTAAPSVFKPVLMSEELYGDGGMVASNPTGVAVHEVSYSFYQYIIIPPSQNLTLGEKRGQTSHPQRSERT